MPRHGRVREHTPATRYAVAMGQRRQPPTEPHADDDAALFREAVGPVRRLRPSPEPPAAPKPRPAARMGAQDEADALEALRRTLESGPLEAGDALSWHRASVPPRTLRQLRRGQFAVQDELDLHHADAAQAEAWLREFLRQAREAGHGCVRIVHGKGRHGDARAPVLKNLVDRLLRQRADVLAYASAPPAQGGTGAVLVLLAPRRRG